MPGFYTHLLLGGLISVLFITLFQRELKAKYIYLGMISSLIPDIDIIVGGFHGINIDTTIFVFPLDILTQITAKFNISDYLDNGIINIEHRGITHSLEFFFIGLVLLMMIFSSGIFLKKLDSFTVLVIICIIGFSWLSHLIADFRLITMQGNGFEIVMSFILWAKYHKRAGIWIERQMLSDEVSITKLQLFFSNQLYNESLF